MDQQEETMFALFGRAVYSAQVIEKYIMNIVISNSYDIILSRTRYEELVYEKSKLTFGQLKRELPEMGIFTPNELKLIDEFQKKRDILAHSFWWDRALEAYEKDLQLKVIEELKDIIEFFDIVNDFTFNQIQVIAEDRKIDIPSEYELMLAQGKTTPLETFRELKKNETVIDIFLYKNAVNSQIPIFKLDDNTYWTVCEDGLSQYKHEVNPGYMSSIDELMGLFPIKQFNPKPKISSFWNYELNLKMKGLKLIVTRDKNVNSMRWVIK